MKQSAARQDALIQEAKSQLATDEQGAAAKRKSLKKQHTVRLQQRLDKRSTAGRMKMQDGAGVGANSNASSVKTVKAIEGDPETVRATIKELFSRFDLDNSGSIDRNELICLLEDTGHISVQNLTDQEDEDEWFKTNPSKYDTDNSGAFGFDEFVIIYNDLKPGGADACKPLG